MWGEETAYGRTRSFLWLLILIEWRIIHDPSSKPVPYFVFAGLQKSTSNHPPELFYSEQGEYSGERTHSATFK